MIQILTGTDACMTPAQLAGALALRSDKRHFWEDKQRYALRCYLSEAFQDALITYALANGHTADRVRVAVMSNNTADVHYCLKGRESVKHETYAANSLRQLVADMNEHLLKPLQIRLSLKWIN